MNCRGVLLLLGLLLLFKAADAQSFSYYGGSGAQIATEAEVIAGKTMNDYLTVQLGSFPNGLNLPAGWTYKVRANGNFTNGTSSIPAQYVSLKFNSSSGSGPGGISGGAVPLSNTDVNLITTSQALTTPPAYYMEQKYNLIIQGGSHLYIQNTGTFTTTITISLYSSTGTLVASKNDITLSFNVTYSNYCTGMALSGSAGNAYNFDTYSKILSGATVTDAVTIAYNPNGATCKAWTLKVRAEGNFVNGASTVAPQNVSLRFNRVNQGSPSAAAIGVGNTAVQLGNSDVILINQSAASFSGYTAHKFDMIIEGGAALMLASTQGTYTCKFVFSLYNQAGLLVSSEDVYMSFNVSFSNTCATAALSGGTGNIYNFSTYAGLQAGATQTDAITLQYQTNTATCIGWSLKVRANGNFVNGASSIAPQYVSLRFGRVSSGLPSAAAIGTASTPVPLGLSDVTLINQSNAAFQGYTEHKLDMIIQGGNHLSAASTSGTYTCPLTFSLYNQSGQLVSTANINASFQITYNNSYNFTITLQNPDVSFTYDSPSDYSTEQSVSKTNGLKVVAYSAHEIIVKTVGPNLTSGGNTMPVSVVKLENTAPADRTAIASTIVNLSSSDQRIVLNPMPNYQYQNVEYNLRYYIPANTGAVAASATGIYDTQVIYIVLPQ